MVGRILIHAGAPKTATTFIQRGLHSNRSVLADNGVYLPETGRLELEPNAVCHHHLAWALITPERYRDSSNGWRALADELAAVESDVVILSSEVFSRVAGKEEGAALVTEAAKKLSDSVTIVYFVRNQLSLFNSLYGQRVKSLRTTETFDGHTQMRRSRRLFNYEALLQPWFTDDSIGFEAVPFTGERDVDPFQALLHVAGLDLPDETFQHDEDEINASLGPVGMEAARLLAAYLRGTFADFDFEEAAAKKLYRLASHRAQENGWCDEPFWGWTAETAQVTADYFAESNNRFARAVWGSEWDIPIPLDRETSAVRLLDLDPPTIEKVHRYVFSLTGRFSKLRAEALAP